MRKKTIEFMGRQSVAFTFQNVTAKIEETISSLEKQELIQTQKQMESYKSTINHEMRTPVETMIIHAKELLKILLVKQRGTQQIPERAFNLCKMIIN